MWAPAVNVPATVTLVAGEGPLFVSVMVKVRWAPTAGLGEADTAIARSATGLAVTVAVEVLFVGLGSNSFALTFAVLARGPDPGGVTVMVAVAELSKGSDANVQMMVVVPLQAGVAETNGAPAGSVSGLFTRCAVGRPRVGPVRASTSVL